MACGDNGTLARLFVEPGSSPYTWDSSSERWEFLNESLVSTGSLLTSEGIRGARSIDAALVRRGPYALGGSIVFNPSPDCLGAWLVRALGGGTVTAPAVADTVPSFAVMLDRVGDVFAYYDCKVNTLTLRGSSGGLLEMTVDILAMGYDDARDDTPPSVSLGTSLNDQPLAFSDLTLTFGGTGYAVNSFELSISNNIDAIVRNGLYPSCLREQDRVIGLNVNVPSNAANIAAFDEPALTGLSGVLTFANSTVGATITLPYLQKARRDPNVGGKTEIRWDLNFTARSSGANAEITCTVDSTP